MILNLNPLDIYAKLLATKTAQRLKVGSKLTSQNFGHSALSSELLSMSDCILAKIKPCSNVQTFIGPNYWRREYDSTNAINIFTDGSKMESGVGAAVYCANPTISEAYKLPNHCSIFQAEVFAIGKAAEAAQN